LAHLARFGLSRDRWSAGPPGGAPPDGWPVAVAGFVGAVSAAGQVGTTFGLVAARSVGVEASVTTGLPAIALSAITQSTATNDAHISAESFMSFSR
jgi:hypothetical protein